MKSDRRVPVAIVGGGFSGTILAAQLARRGIALGPDRRQRADGPRRRLFDDRAGASAQRPRRRDERLGRRARPFRRGASKREGGDRRGFAQRRLFGRYLGEILDEAVASGSTQVDRRDAPSARRAANGGWRIALDDGATIEAEALVLAVGNQEPEVAAALSRAPATRFIRNPWGADASAAVAELAAERRRRAAGRHRPDHGRPRAVARRGRPSAAGSSPCRGAA